MKSYRYFPLLIPLFLFSLLVSVNAYAKDNSGNPEIKKYGLITPPVCKIDTGEIIKHYPGTSEQIVEFGGFLAAAGDFEVGKNGGIVNEDRIYYDETNMPFLHPLLQEFLFRHECAHVKLNHLQIPISQRQGLYWDIEQGADCQALAEMKLDSPNFPKEANLVLENFSYIADIMMTSSPGNNARKKQFIERRIHNILACNALKK